MASCFSNKALIKAVKRIPGASINRIKDLLMELGTIVYSGGMGLSVQLSSDTQTLSPLPSGSDISHLLFSMNSARLLALPHNRIIETFIFRVKWKSVANFVESKRLFLEILKNELERHLCNENF